MTVFLNIKKHGKGAGNTGLTQATLGGTPIVDEEDVQYQGFGRM